MATWVINVDFGAGDVDITEHCSGIERELTAHKDLKPVVNTAKFTVTDLATVNLFLAGDNDLPVTITKDGADWFTGQVRPTYDAGMASAIEPMNIQCVDNSIDLQKTIDESFVWTGYKVCDTGATGSSIVHQLLVKAGYALGEMSLTTIDVVISKLSVDRDNKKTYWKQLSAILYEFGYVLDYGVDGIFVMRDMHPAALTPALLLDEQTAHMRQTKRKRQRVEAVRITWHPVVTFTGVMVFCDRTGGDDTNPMNVDLADGVYYPVNSDVDTVYAAYRYDDAVILDVTNEVLTWSKDDAVTLDTENYGSTKADIKFVGGVGDGTLTRFEIRGDATVRDKTKVRREVVYNVVGTERIMEHTAQYIEALVDAQAFASDITNYYDYAKFNYVFEALHGSPIDHLVALYSFDQDDLTDSSGNGFDGTGATDITYEDGTYGRRAIFDGAGSHFDLPAGVYGAITLQSEWAISVRMRADTVDPAEGDVRVTQLGNTDAEIEIMWDNANDRWMGRIQDSAGANTTEVYGTTIVADVDHDLVLSCDGAGTLSFFQDGMLTDTADITGLADWTADEGWVGGMGGANNIDGRIDQIRFYDCGFTRADAMAMHDNPGEAVVRELMSEFTLDSVAQAASTDMRVISIREDEEGRRFVTAEGISAYSPLATETQDTYVPPSVIAPVDDIDRLVTKEEDQLGYTDTGSGGTTVPTVPVLATVSAQLAVVLSCDRQDNLTNFARYEWQVSDDAGVTAYALGYDGTGLGAVDGDTDIISEFHIHRPLPLDVTAGDDDPVAKTWHYRVRRVTVVAAVSAWSGWTAGESQPIGSGTLGENVIYAMQIFAGAVGPPELAANALAYPSDGLAAYYSMDDVAITDTLIDTSGHELHATKVGFGPVARYTFDDDTADDSSGNGHDGTPTDVTYEDSDYGRAAVFNGTTSNITLPSGLPAGDISVSVRFKASKGGAANRMFWSQDTGAGAAQQRTFYIDTSDRIIFKTERSDGTTTVISLAPAASWTADQWTDVVGMQDGLTTRIYVNGAVIDEDTHADIYASFLATGDIGSRATTDPYDDVIDEVRIYDYGLTADSALALHDRPVAPAEVVAGVAGNALALSGDGQYGTIPSGLPAGDISVSLWFKAAKGGAANRMFWSQDTGAGAAQQRTFYIDPSDDIIFKSERSDGTTTILSYATTTAWTADEWTHVVGMQDGLTTRIYVGGALIDEDTHADIYTSFLATGDIGSRAGLDCHDCIIDEVRPFNRVLTAAEVASLYRFPGGMEPGVVPGSWIADASIITDKLYAEELSAITANLGTITAGIIRSTDWGAADGVEFDLSTGRLRMGGSTAPAVDFDPDAGTYSFTGSLITESGNYKTSVSAGTIKFYYSGSIVGNIEGYSADTLVIRGEDKVNSPHIQLNSSGAPYLLLGIWQASVFYSCMHVYYDSVAFSKYPRPNGTVNLGGVSSRWSTIYGVNLNVSGDITCTGDITCDDIGCDDITCDHIGATSIAAGYVAHTNQAPVGASSIGAGANDVYDRIHSRDAAGVAHELSHSAGW